MTLFFSLDFPIEVDCFIQLDFPSDYEASPATLTSHNAILTSNQLVSAVPSGFFQTSTTSTITVVGSNGGVGGSVDQFIRYNTVTSPSLVKSTGFFTLTLRDVGNQIIATNSDTLYIDETDIDPGSMTATIGLTTDLVQETSVAYTFTFTPSHDLVDDATYDPKIVINLPAGLALPAQSTCSISSVTGLDAGYTCSQPNNGADNQIEITDPFGGTYTGGNQVSFVISGITNAQVSGSPGTLQSYTMLDDGADDYRGWVRVDNRHRDGGWHHHEWRCEWDLVCCICRGCDLHDRVPASTLCATGRSSRGHTA